jgi:foldase protein PrsA
VSTAKATRRLLTGTLAMLLAVTGVGGCGDDNAGSVAVEVSHQSISRGSVKHWMEVIAGEVSTSPGQPKPGVPSPPKYTACVSYKRKYPIAPANGESTPSQLRQECAFEFEKERLKALYFLISSDWLDGAASELGVRPGDSELRSQVASVEARFPSKATARRFLVGTRGTEADLFARLKATVLTTAIQQKLEAQSREKGLSKPDRQRSLEEFSKRFESTWRARTSCRPGYVVPICRQRYVPPRAAATLRPPDVPLTKMTAE